MPRIPRDFDNQAQTGVFAPPRADADFSAAGGAKQGAGAVEREPDGAVEEVQVFGVCGVEV